MENRRFHKPLALLRPVVESSRETSAKARAWLVAVLIVRMLNKGKGRASDHYIFLVDSMPAKSLSHATQTPRSDSSHIKCISTCHSQRLRPLKDSTTSAPLRRLLLPNTSPPPPLPDSPIHFASCHSIPNQAHCYPETLYIAISLLIVKEKHIGEVHSTLLLYFRKMLLLITREDL